MVMVDFVDVDVELDNYFVDVRGDGVEMVVILAIKVECCRSRDIDVEVDVLHWKLML